LRCQRPRKEIGLRSHPPVVLVECGEARGTQGNLAIAATLYLCVILRLTIPSNRVHPHKHCATDPAKRMETDLDLRAFVGRRNEEGKSRVNVGLESGRCLATLPSTVRRYSGRITSALGRLRTCPRDRSSPARSFRELRTDTNAAVGA